MFSTSKYPIGLDISDSSLKLIQLKKSSKIKLYKQNKVVKPQINCYNSIKLPSGIINNGQIINQEKVIKHIKKLLDGVSGGKISSKNTVAVLPTAKTFIKLVNINNSSEEKILDKIKSEITKEIPLDLNNIYIDWQIIKSNKKTSDVLVATASKDTVDLYIDTMEKASLQPIALEIEAVAIHRALISELSSKKDSDSNLFLIIDFGASRSSIIACSNESIFFTIGTPISGIGITQLISDTLQIDPKKAEQSKKICGFDENKCKGALREILDETINELISYIEKALSFAESNYSNYNIKNIIITGGGANFLKINEVISQKTKIPVITGNPWDKIQADNNKIFAEKYKLHTTALGLSLRSISDENLSTI